MHSTKPSLRHSIECSPRDRSISWAGSPAADAGPASPAGPPPSPPDQPRRRTIQASSHGHWVAHVGSIQVYVVVAPGGA